RRDAGGDAGNDAERHARCGERHGFFGAASEHAGVATLQPQNTLAGAREGDEPLADVGLLRRWFAAALAGKFEPRLRAGERQDAAIDQGIVDDDIRLREAGGRVEGQQAGIARPGAGEPDMARFEQRHAVATSAPLPKFVIHCGTLIYELRKQRGTSKSMIPVPLVDLKFLNARAAGAVGTS